MIAFKDATMYEVQAGRLWATVPFLRFLRCGRKPRIGWER